MMALIESRYNTAVEDGLPTEPYQKLVNEINTLVASYNNYIFKPIKTLSIIRLNVAGALQRPKGMTLK